MSRKNKAPIELLQQ